MRHRPPDKPGKHRGHPHKEPRSPSPAREHPRGASPFKTGPFKASPSKTKGRAEPWDARPERPPRRDEPRRGAPGEQGERSFAERPRGERQRGERPRGQHGGERSRKKSWRPAARLRDGRVVLYGWHTVKAALENPARQIHRLLASETAAERLAKEVDLRLTPEVVRGDALDALVGSDAVHQGLVAEAEALEAPAIEDLAPRGLILVLDQITDPHNVGAILRSAAAFAVEAVVTTERHSPEATGVLAKAASGALEYVPMVTVVNLARGLEVLKDKDVLLVGLDSAGTDDLTQVPMRAPLALVLGAEGKGLRQLTRTTCDALARLDLPGRIKSLNVSNAAALALQVASTRLRALT